MGLSGAVSGARVAIIAGVIVAPYLTLDSISFVAKEECRYRCYAYGFRQNVCFDDDTIHNKC
jgi:hypothetical protein